MCESVHSTIDQSPGSKNWRASEWEQQQKQPPDQFTRKSLVNWGRICSTLLQGCFKKPSKKLAKQRCIQIMCLALGQPFGERVTGLFSKLEFLLNLSISGLKSRSLFTLASLLSWFKRKFKLIKLWHKLIWINLYRDKVWFSDGSL